MPDVMPTPRPIPTPAGREFTRSRLSTNVVGGYDATDGRGRRRPPQTQTMAEDVHADERRRRILSATTQDLARNFVIASWAIRKTLDFIADFTFKANTPDAGFNKYYQAWWKEKCRKHNFDAAARHPHRRAIRLAEAGRIVDGDVFWLKLAPPKGNPLRGKVQTIESDRVAMPAGEIPKNSDPTEWINGVRCDKSGRAVAYGICDRVGRTQKKLQRIVPARNIIPHAAYEFRNDQVRGVSPITASLNHFKDVQESIDFALAKIKLSQLFGLQIISKDDGTGAYSGPASVALEGDADGDGTNDSEPRITLNRGPFISELEPGEEVKVVESSTPSTETLAFINLMIHLSLRALDIPPSFLDESRTNFFGSRGALIQYLHSCNNKVADLQDFLDEHHLWCASLAIEDGELELPSGKDFSFLQHEFVPGGIPWWDSTKEVRGAAMGVAAGFTSPIRVCQETGTNVFQNIDETAEVQAYAKSKGVTLNYGDSTAFGPEINVAAAEAANAN